MSEVRMRGGLGEAAVKVDSADDVLTLDPPTLIPDVTDDWGLGWGLQEGEQGHEMAGRLEVLVQSWS